ncbi:MAG: hypothetical protein ACRD0A_07195 [Acidimicrobiales bacterium]
MNQRPRQPPPLFGVEAAAAQQSVPAAPELTTDAPPIVTTPTVRVTGTAEFRSTESVLRDGAEVAVVAPDRDRSYTVEVGLVEGPNVITAAATNFAGSSAPSDEVTIMLDTTGPALAWTPLDRDGFFDPVARVTGTAGDAIAGTAPVEVNGRPVTVGPGGRFATNVALGVGQDTITGISTDVVGNKTTERRTVRLFPYDAERELRRDAVSGGFDAFLRVVGANGQPVQVAAATLEVRDSAGQVVLSVRWPGYLRSVATTLGSPGCRAASTRSGRCSTSTAGGSSRAPARPGCAELALARRRVGVGVGPSESFGALHHIQRGETRPIPRRTGRT